MWKARETAHHAIDEVHVCIWTCNTCNVCNVCNSKIFGGLTVSRGEPVLDLECLQRLPETQFGLHNGSLDDVAMMDTSPVPRMPKMPRMKMCEMFVRLRPVKNVVLPPPGHFQDAIFSPFSGNDSERPNLFQVHGVSR